jgi:MinD-like ATPase involved in chromosome partitioning or flagellar assembly
MRPRFILEINNYEAIQRFINFHEELMAILDIDAIGEMYSTRKQWEEGVLAYLRKQKKLAAKRAKKRAAKEKEQLRRARDQQIARDAQRLEATQMFDSEDAMN